MRLKGSGAGGTGKNAEVAMDRLRVLLPLLLVVVMSSGCAGMGGGVKEARPAPDFSVKLMGGGEAKLSEFKGRPLVLNFGASWCPHCLHELPTLKGAYDKYKDRVGFLVVFAKSPENEVAELIDKDSLSFKVGLDPDAVVGKAYGVKGIPVTFFIDGDGNIVDDYFGGIDEGRLTSLIDSMLEEASKHPRVK